jgi:ABC-type transporter Mla subunit MlaD
VFLVTATGVLLLLGVLLIGARSRLAELADELQNTLGAVQRALFHLEELGRELRDRELVEKLDLALQSAYGAVGRLDPLASGLEATLSDAREMLDDATQTSQSVRARVEDLAAVQAELSALTGAFTDVLKELRDRELAAKLTNVLSDASLLAADIGVLTENANSYLESGKPLVSNVGSVVASAKTRAGSLSRTIGSLREGFRAGAQVWQDEGKKPE